MIKKVGTTVALVGAGALLYSGTRWLLGSYDSEVEFDEEDEEEEDEDEDEDESEEEGGKDSALVAFNWELQTVRGSLPSNDRKVFDLAVSQLKSYLESLDNSYKQQAAAQEISRSMLLAMSARNSSRGESSAFASFYSVDMLDVASPRLEEAVLFSGAPAEAVEVAKDAASEFLQVLRKTTKKVQLA